MKLHLSSNPPVDCILGQFSPIHSFITYKTHFNIIIPPILASQVLFYHEVYQSMFHHFLLPSLICPAHPGFGVFTFAIAGKFISSETFLS
jgi:hypothetical protein